MRLGIDVGVHAQSRTQFVPAALGDLDQIGQLGLGFDIEPADLGVDGLLNFDIGFADAREYDSRRVRSTFDRAIQLATADHIHARALLGQQVYDVDVLAAFDRVAKNGVQLAEGVGDLGVMIYKG